MMMANRNEMTAAIDDLQMEYRLLEAGRMLVMSDAAPGGDIGSRINARKKTINSEIAAIEFSRRVFGWHVPAPEGRAETLRGSREPPA
jgi:hypothetical protein